MNDQAYTPTLKQAALRKAIGALLGRTEDNVAEFCAYGGSRSGKTFEYIRTIVFRALAAPRSNHAVFRFRFNHCKASIIYGTFPDVLAKCFPGIGGSLNKSDWFYEFQNGSRVWFGGLDDKERTEKILGQEHATIFLNEISQMAYGAVLMAKTRLAQKAEYTIDGVKRVLRLLMLYDMNPPPRSHWSYDYFVRKLDPDSKRPLKNAKSIDMMRLNPRDNEENLPRGYIATLEAMPARFRARFLLGEFADALPGALWTIEMIEANRVDEAPDLVRVVVGVDPSGADDEDNAHNDEIGTLVVGVDAKGVTYVLEDCTIKAGPGTWGANAVNAFDRHAGDRVVAEVNFGGAMVKHVIATAAKDAGMVVPFRTVIASRGKSVRAEPVSALTEQGKLKFVGTFPRLEDEMCSFTTHGFVGSNSPNRVDALVWAVSDLIPGITRREVSAAKKKETRERYRRAPPSIAINSSVL